MNLNVSIAQKNPPCKMCFNMALNLNTYAHLPILFTFGFAKKNTKGKCSGISCTFREKIYREYDS